VSNEEWAVYDIVSLLSTLGFVAGLLILGQGLKSLWVAKAESPRFTRRALKCHAFKAIFLAAVFVYMHHRAGELMHIVNTHKWHHSRGDQKGEAPDMPILPPIQDEQMGSKKHNGRKLSQHVSLLDPQVFNNVDFDFDRLFEDLD